ncbi:MAG: contractile injection system protein, VgrG/Pvc8 family [Rhodocyclaceae bacterium]|nr:contractile injection system protein, VgrG/Pvc8 family [Rhodocyclaceae bacterium]
MTYARPAWTLTVDGNDITADIADRLISLTLTDNPGFEADQLDIELDDSDGKLDLPPRGALIRLALGWSRDGLSTLVDKGSYTVDDIAHSGAPDKLTVRARSADLRSGLTTQRERSFHGKTLGDIVRTIADENALTPAISTALDAEVIDHVDQTNESSANLLTRLSRMFDAIAAVKSERLLFVHSGRGASASGTPFPPVLIERGDGDSHLFEISDRDSYTHVRATYNDIGKAEKGEVIWGKEEDTAENQRHTPVAAPTPEAKAEYKPVGSRPAKSRTAAQRFAHKEWLRLSKDKAFRARYSGVEAAYDDRNLKAQGKVTFGRADEEKSQAHAAKLAMNDATAAQARSGTAAPQVGIDHSADNIKTIRHVYATKENARRGARAKWRELQRGVATFSITLASGRPELIPETPATVRGWKPAIDSTDWITARVVHNVTDAGYTTAASLVIRATEIPG